MVDFEHFAAYLNIFGLLTGSVIVIVVGHLLVHVSFLEGTPLGVGTLLPGNSSCVKQVDLICWHKYMDVLVLGRIVRQLDA